MWTPIEEAARAGDLALMGTCAGAILMGRRDEERPPRWGLLDARVERNAYGRQVDSFAAEVLLEGGGPQPFHAVFIRAPRFADVGPGVEVLARHAGEPVLLAAGRLLAAAFHPELTEDLRVHRRFLEGA
jgi:5'-phosphate synthase pdxT subunit